MVKKMPTVATTISESIPPALAFDAVSFGYRRHQVVRDVTLQLATGEMVGLLGPNGAGKSTLLRLGAGALRPQVGSVYLHGAAIAAALAP